MFKIKPKVEVTLPFAALCPSAINAMLEQGAFLVTANQRLSRFRMQSFEQVQINAQQQAWQTPEILSWQTWLKQAWQAENLGVWLSNTQESLLWREAVQEDSQTNVLNPKALSKQAMDAWKILADYHIDPSCLHDAGEEHQALVRWANAVQNKLAHKQEASPFFQSHQVLAALTRYSKVSQQKKLMLDGFDSFSPAQLSYFEHLQDTGTAIYQVVSSSTPKDTKLQRYADEESEIRQVCHQVRHIVQQHPEAKVAIFVPNLEQHANQISRICQEELAPALSLSADCDQQGDYFNISVGSVLAKQTMIESAFILLSLSIKPLLHYQDISELLLNPYIAGYSTEAIPRAQLDASLRRRNNAQLPLLQLLQAGQNSGLPMPMFLQSLQQLQQRIHHGQDFSGKHTLSYWVIFAEALLQDMQWHEQANSANEHTQVQNWRDLMQQLTTLDDFCGLLRWSEALGRLQEYAFEQPFRAAPGQANIQIMGLLEAVNLRFDHAFVVSMDDQTWPPAAKPNPLIPVDIQVKHQTPHANSEREWDFSQSVWQHLLQVSPDMHISYASTRDKQDMQASPLLQGLPIQQESNLNSMRYAASLQQQQPSLLNIHDTPIAVSNSKDITGGTGLLKSQSACAFQAFSTYRLHLHSIDTPCQGLNASEQGTLLHAALEKFWQKISSQKNLLQHIEQDTLQPEIESSIQQAWKDIKRPIATNTKALEAERLLHLLNQWLLFESQRTPFVVSYSEVWRDVCLGSAKPLSLHTKIDRIDKDAQGHHIIIDYKTGISAANKALGERPDEPQLPIYYLAEQGKKRDVSALAFAQVRPADLAFKGFAQDDNILPLLKTYQGKKDQPNDWAELVAQWQEVLHNLADQFMAGEAQVSPKSSLSCRYCTYAGLCRFNAAA